MGKAMSHKEMRYVIARLAATMDIALVDGFDAKAFRDGLLNMRTPMFEKRLMVKVQRRKGVDIDELMN